MADSSKPDLAERQARLLRLLDLDVEPDPESADAWFLIHELQDGGLVRVLHATDGQSNTCSHHSATGVDTAPISPEKVWSCDHCGLRWRTDGAPL